MEQLFVGLDVSKDETAICVRTQCGIVKAAFAKARLRYAARTSNRSASDRRGLQAYLACCLRIM